MKSSGLGAAAYFGLEPEFFVFDSVRGGVDMSGCFCKSESEEAPEGLMNGPVISAVGRDDVVSNQEQVDDLLESLGF